MEKRKKYACPSIQNGSNIIHSAFEFIFDFILDLITGTKFCPRSIPLNIMLSNLDRHSFGLSPHSELLISNEEIRLYDYEILLYTIPRESLHMNHFVKHDNLYFVFSKDSIEKLKKDELIELIKNKKAFCFPYVWQAQIDFPELFRIK